MSNQQQKKSLLDAYRTIGGFISGKLSLSQSSPTALTTATGCSFKVYSENLAIKVASPSFPHPITAAVSYNEYTYIRTAQQVIKMKYHHIVDQWQVAGGESRCTILKFEEIIILNDKRRLIIIDEKTSQVSEQEYAFEIEGIVHPVTYVNKVILYGASNFALVNVITNKLLYSFQRFIESCNTNDQKITVVEPTPLVDIVGVGFDNGLISFLNLRKDQVVFSIRQKLAVTALGFSRDQSWLASGDEMGNVILWDLQNKRILYKYEQALKGVIDSLVFLPGLPVLTCGSSVANSLRQLKVNLDDNKVLSLYRERQGSKEALQTIQIANNNELVLSTASESMFVSFHSQCNNYLLPRTLDSKLPYHLIAKNFNVELYKGNSLEKSFQLHEYAVTAKISLSNKYYVVATKRKLIKLGASLPIEWAIPNIRSIILYNEHSIFAFTPTQIVVCDFNTETILARIAVNAGVPCTNTSNTLLSFENRQQKQIQVWDMLKITQGRVYGTLTRGEALCLSFTADNRFLISTHTGGKVNIWSVVDNQLYKTFNLQGGEEMIWHCFTPDNQFMVSIFKGKKQANVWNNYIGRLTSSRNEESLAFTPEIRCLQKDYRLELLNKVQEQLAFTESTEDIIDSIPDADDELPNYNFNDITKWMPLVYYDEIRTRNAPNKSGQTPSMPFFLDFKNLTQEKKKIEQEIQAQIREKRKNYSEQKDKHLKNQANELTVNEDSTLEQQLDAFLQLSSLSVAEVDYQLRTFLLNPSNKPHLVNMLSAVFEDRTRNFHQQLKNIILNRVINLLGADLLSSELSQPCTRLLQVVQPGLTELKQLVDRCISITNKHTQ